MTISEATIKELQQILKEDYGKETNLAETSEIATTLVNYFDLLTRIYYQEKLKNNHNNDKNTSN